MIGMKENDCSLVRMGDRDLFLANSAVEKLVDMAEYLDVMSVCGKYLGSSDFATWTGSAESFQHHYGTGGLARHTCEVVELCFQVLEYYIKLGMGKIDSVELFLAAFFHDLGKLHDFQKVDGIWCGSDHKRYIHHISRSAIIWSEEVKKNQYIYDMYYEKVLHAILAHHGNRGAGSPVAPKSRVAWLVHFCDGISARYADADTLDVIHGEVKSD